LHALVHTLLYSVHYNSGAAIFVPWQAIGSMWKRTVKYVFCTGRFSPTPSIFFRPRSFFSCFALLIILTNIFSWRKIDVQVPIILLKRRYYCFHVSFLIGEISLCIWSMVITFLLHSFVSITSYGEQSLLYVELVLWNVGSPWNIILPVFDISLY